MKGYLKPRMKAFVADPRSDRANMDVEWWARECGVGVEDVRAAWEAAMTRHSTKPQNTYGEGEGK